jgi:hypothetical protein
LFFSTRGKSGVIHLFPFCDFEKKVSKQKKWSIVNTFFCWKYSTHCPQGSTQRFPPLYPYSWLDGDGDDMVKMCNLWTFILASESGSYLEHGHTWT